VPIIGNGSVVAETGNTDICEAITVSFKAPTASSKKMMASGCDSGLPKLEMFISRTVEGSIKIPIANSGFLTVDGELEKSVAK